VTTTAGGRLTRPIVKVATSSEHPVGLERHTPSHTAIFTPQQSGMARTRRGDQNLPVVSALTVERVRRDIDVLARAGLDLDTFFAEMAESLQRVVPFRAMCGALVDPTTRLCTTTFKLGDLRPDPEADARWGIFEYGEANPTSFAALADRPVPAAAVHLEDDPAVSLQRQREFLQPTYTFTDEARVAAVAQGRMWGGIALHRGADDRRFTEDEVGVLADLSSTFAIGLRSGLMAKRVASNRVVSHGPAVLIVDKDGRLAQTNASATAWLDEIGSAGMDAGAASAIAAIATHARRFAGGLDATPPTIRVRSRSGRWLVLNASLLAGNAQRDGDVVITIEEARPPEIVALVVSAYELTPRERDVVRHVLQGASTKEIATALGMSTYTVQDHLKSIFEKAGVRSRRELMSLVFFDQYVPRMGNDIGPDGWFVD
jgi:DNA-binding CsgD family transcriptional regulator